MVKVTVITPTYRETQRIIDQARWLEGQTMAKEEFEWVILDDLYEQRHEEVARLNTSYRILHLPSGVESPYRRPSEAVNRGLVHAQGVLVHIMADYIAQYMLALEQEAKADDMVVRMEGVRILIDPDSAPLMEGAEIDYMDGLMRSGFVINNPNIQSGGCGEGCGCGGGGGGCACGGH